MAPRSNDWKTNPIGQRAVDFVSKLKLIGDYTGQTWHLDPWQDELIRKLFGTRRPDGTRVYKTLFLLLGRKQGKTQIAAAIGLVQLFLGPPGQEIYAASSDRDKASRLYKAMAGMIRQDKVLSQLCECTDHYLRIKIASRDIVFQALAADSDQGHSLSPSTLILDELHLWKGRDLYDALTSGAGARKDRLEIQISTAGKTRQGLLWDLYTYAKNVKSGLFQNPELLPVIYEADEDDDWTDEKVWHKAMPALGSYCNLDYIRSQCAKAQKIKSEEFAFRQLFLGQWIEQAPDTWVSLDEWNTCKTKYTAKSLKGEECYAGLDLSSVRDLTALSLYFPESGKTLSWCWLPSEGIADRQEKDGVPYLLWEQQGHLIFTTGARIVHSEVAKKINEVLNAYHVVKFVCDPRDVNLIAPHLSQEPELYPQYPKYMSPPTKWLETAVAEGKVKHNGNPLLAWCMSNTVVKDGVPSKTLSRKRIDPVAALVMAVGAWLGSVNETPVVDANTFYASKENFIL